MSDPAPPRLMRPGALASLAIALVACSLGCAPRPGVTKRAVVASAVPSPTPSAFAPLTAVQPLAPATPGAGASSCLQSEGRIVSSQVPSVLLGHALGFLRYLPPCYATASDQTYPILYLFQGADRGQEQWLELGIQATADSLIHAGRIPALVIVMPKDQGEPLLEAAVLSDLLPALGRGRPAPLGRARQAVGGIGRGAPRALNLALQRPDLFGAVGLHSPWEAEGDLANVRQWAAKIPADLRPRVYLDVGQEDPSLPQAVSLRAALVESGLAVDWQLQPGTHSDDYWRGHLGEYLVWYSQLWQ